MHTQEDGFKMIHILIETLGCSLFMIIVVLYCINRRQIDATSDSKIIQGVIKKSGTKKRIYMIGSAVVLFFLGVWLPLLYPDNDILVNIRSVIVVSLLLIAAYYDYIEYRIPNNLILLGLTFWALITIAGFFLYHEKEFNYLILEIIICIAFGIISAISLLVVKNGMGMGDIKLLLLVGLIEKTDGVISSIFASLVLIFIASVFCLITNKKNKNDVLPFAPFVMIGTIISITLMGC